MPRDRVAYNAYMKEYLLKRYHKRMEAARVSLGGKCVVCGSTDSLHLHHLDPKMKEGALAKIWSWSETRFWAEVEKCELRCEDCHKKEHQSKAEHGTAQRYWRGCHCQPCTTANTVWNREYLARRTLGYEQDGTAYDF